MRLATKLFVVTDLYNKSLILKNNKMNKETIKKYIGQYTYAILYFLVMFILIVNIQNMYNFIIKLLL